MSVSTNFQTAVINAGAGNIRDLLGISAGKLLVSGNVTTNTTNRSWSESIPWADVTKYSKELYQAGVQKAIKINFNSTLHPFVAGKKLIMTVKWFDPTTKHNKSQPFTVYAKAAATLTIYEQVCLQFYNALNVAGYPWTVVQTSSTLLTITFAIGTTATLSGDAEISMDWVSTATPVAITNIVDSSSTKVTITGTANGLAVNKMVKLYGVTWTDGVLPTAGDFKTSGYLITDKATDNFKVAFAIAGTTYGSDGYYQEVVQMDSVSYVKAQGTAALVELDLVGGSQSGYTYVKYILTHYKKVQADHGLFPEKELVSVVYVKTTLTDVIAYLDAIFSGLAIPMATSSGITKANPGVVTTTGIHFFNVGDRVLISAATINPTLLNGLVCVVKSVADSTHFTLDYDCSGLANAETVANIYLFRQEKAFLAK